MKDGSVLVVVVNWNGGETVCSCLDSIASQTHERIRTVIVDNGSTDGSLEAIRQDYAWAGLIQNETNVGYCRALNQGINYSESEFVLCLNSDVRLEDDYVEKALETLGAMSHCGMLAGKMLRFDRVTLDSAGQFIGRDRRPKERGYGEADRGQYDRKQLVFSVCGAVAFYRRKMLDQVALGGQYFDEDYFAFNEDLDIGWRGQLAGWKCVYEPAALAYHKRGGTAPPGTSSTLFSARQFVRRQAHTRYHIVKNRYLTMVKNDLRDSLLADMPVIIAFDAALWAFVLLSSPSLYLRIPGMVRGVLGALRKRAFVQSARSVDSNVIRGGIV